MFCNTHHCLISFIFFPKVALDNPGFLINRDIPDLT